MCGHVYMYVSHAAHTQVHVILKHAQKAIVKGAFKERKCLVFKLTEVRHVVKAS